MPPTLRVSALFVVSVALIAFAAPAAGEPGDEIPGDGVFLVGPDIAPGLYHTAGSASAFGVWINNVPTQESMCSWFSYGTPDAAKDHVLQTNTSIGPMYANINTTVKAFESRLRRSGRFRTMRNTASSREAVTEPSAPAASAS